jgi:hypothetical protein
MEQFNGSTSCAQSIQREATSPDPICLITGSKVDAFVFPLISLGVSRSRYKWAITGDMWRSARRGLTPSSQGGVFSPPPNDERHSLLEVWVT